MIKIMKIVFDSEDFGSAAHLHSLYRNHIVCIQQPAHSYRDSSLPVKVELSLIYRSQNQKR